MSPRIRILPENLTNKIAAGEVVERPASVVKELLENALDAGCSDVTVEIEAGGKRLIRVTDNGSGMSREDALLALERHATSKIASERDLEGISTLGFRGEALPSIASVSRFVLATREPGTVEGTEIYAEGGRIREVKACGMAAGTVLTVRNLFFNTPARLKFLKSTETEAGHVGDLVTRLAISRPDVRFAYVNDGKTVFRLPDGDTRERVSALLGRTLAADLYPVATGEEGVRVEGLIARPECSRSAPAHIYTFVNGRFVRDRVVQHAILQAYRNLLERGRYPVVALFIDISPDGVDVNVHPTKHEVRFREQGRVHDAIRNALESVLRATPWIKPSAFSSPAAGAKAAEVRETLARYRPEPQRHLKFGMRNAEFGIQDAKLLTPHSALHARDPGLETRDLRLETAPETAGYFSSLAVIGQFNASYILCQDETDLVLIDQHAAHERVAFERLKAQFAEGGVEAQGLLFPETLELSFREGAALRENLSGISRLGFELEEFGGGTCLLNAIPRLLTGGDYVRVLRDILEELQSLGKSRTFTDALEEILSRIACHSVVRGVHPLSHQEIRALFVQMDATDFSSNCPHGRPVLQRLALAEIERMFKRQ